MIAEEEVAAGRIPAHDDTYFLVDPLDGTKEFVRGGDDYTVNIGLIEHGVPKLGVVFAPATGRLHGGVRAEVVRGSTKGSVAARSVPGHAAMQLTAVASKSHLNQATIDYLRKPPATCGYVAVGSSLKFCILAEGDADIYPRASPTSEWDTAAGHAVLLAAGGLVDGPDGHRCATASRHSSTAPSLQPPGGNRRGSNPFSSHSRAAAIFRKAFSRRRPAGPWQKSNPFWTNLRARLHRSAEPQRLDFELRGLDAKVQLISAVRSPPSSSPSRRAVAAPRPSASDNSASQRARSRPASQLVRCTSGPPATISRFTRS